MIALGILLLRATGGERSAEVLCVCVLPLFLAISFALFWRLFLIAEFVRNIVEGLDDTLV